MTLLQVLVGRPVEMDDGRMNFGVLDVEEIGPRDAALIDAGALAVVDPEAELPPYGPAQQFAIVELDGPAVPGHVLTVVEGGFEPFGPDAAIVKPLPLPPGTGGGTPDPGSVTDSSVASNAGIAESKLDLAVDAAPGIASRRTLGSGPQQAAAGDHGHAALSVGSAGSATVRRLGTGSLEAAAGDDPRLSDARTPLAHAHGQSEVTGLSAALAARVLVDRTWINARDVGAVADGVTNDAPALQAAIDDAAETDGRPIYLPPTPVGYRINAPLVMRRGTRLIGDHRPSYFPGNWRPAFVFAGAGFSGTAMITVDGATSPTPAGGSIEGLALYGSQLASGIDWFGSCPDWLVRDVEVFEIAASGFGFRSRGNGTSAPQQALRFENCRVFRNVNAPAGSGWVFEDRSFDHQVIGCVASHLADGFVLGGAARSCSSVEWHACRAEWCSGSGWSMASGDNCLLNGCSTDRNGVYGVFVQAGALDGPLVLNGCLLKRDGRLGSGAGLRVADTATVLASNVAIRRGTDDGGTTAPGPAYGVWVSGAGTRVMFQGQAAGVTNAERVDSGSFRHSGGSLLDTNGTVTYAAPSPS